jgi:outer membrane protein TolC
MNHPSNFVWLLSFSLLMHIAGSAQVFSLSDAEARARNHYPSIRQIDLIKQSADLAIENLSRNNYPQLSFNSQLSYQSAVTEVSIPNAPFKIEPPAKDQYRFNMDVSQTIYDGGMLKSQKDLSRLRSSLDEGQMEIEWQKIRERVQQLYCGILYADAMIRQVGSVLQDIENGIQKVEAQVQGGVALRTSLDILRADKLKTQQRQIELQASRTSLLKVLEIFTDTSFAFSTQFSEPELFTDKEGGLDALQRNQFSLRNKLTDKQNEQIRAKGLPRASVFLQGGYGRPGLNLLKNSFEFYGLGGLRLNWPIANLYTSRNEKQIVQISKRQLSLEEEKYDQQTRAAIQQQYAEISKWKELIEKDKEIIGIRRSIKEASAAQLEAGVATSSDYLREVNAEDQAVQVMKSHEIQLLQARLQLQLLTGKTTIHE